MEDIKYDYIKTINVIIKDIKNPYSKENKEIYRNKVKNSLIYLSNQLIDNDYLKPCIYDISEIYENTNTVILSFNSHASIDSEIINDKQILVI